MKTFEELQEVVHSINDMEKIFRDVVLISCHHKQIQKYTELKDLVFDILVQDIQEAR